MGALMFQLGLGATDAAVLQGMFFQTMGLVKTAVHNQLLIHSETEDQRHRRNARALYRVVH